jgi:hypothetical protein
VAIFFASCMLVAACSAVTVTRRIQKYGKGATVRDVVDQLNRMSSDWGCLF